MTMTRRTLIQAGAAGALTALFRPTYAQTASGLKISHQFPGGTLTEGDFRDRLCRKAHQRRAEGIRLSRLIADED